VDLRCLNFISQGKKDDFDILALLESIIACLCKLQCPFQLELDGDWRRNFLQEKHVGSKFALN
jgi:hypothetical protein